LIRAWLRPGSRCCGELPLTVADQALLATDMHGDNILAAQREPWLVIDPKPYVGDPACDLLPLMLNCEDRLAADPTGWRHWPGLTPTGCGSGYSPAACRSRSAHRSCARLAARLAPA
jgi:Aminoglycoside/hydroxyurea antibiotic resistance kinase